ncbi:integumentary mucin C.1-like [Homarus americanus]|uniref:integumentary mucin C.1-like n=1 Tax=Homarus americanus TaxID=6706 RepID=UPI001C44BDF0|nr:integumentary mucin C.1-like [Homarus americanus]
MNHGVEERRIVRPNVKETTEVTLRPFALLGRSRLTIKRPQRKTRDLAGVGPQVPKITVDQFTLHSHLNGTLCGAANEVSNIVMKNKNDNASLEVKVGDRCSLHDWKQIQKDELNFFKTVSHYTSLFLVNQKDPFKVVTDGKWHSLSLSAQQLIGGGHLTIVFDREELLNVTLPGDVSNTTIKADSKVLWCRQGDSFTEMSTSSHTTTPQSVSTTPQSVTTTPQSVTTTPQSVTTTPQSVTTTPQFEITTPLSVTTTPESVTTTSESVTTTPQSATSKPQSVATTPESVTSSPEPLTTTPESLLDEAPLLQEVELQYKGSATTRALDLTAFLLKSTNMEVPI